MQVNSVKDIYADLLSRIQGYYDKVQLVIGRSSVDSVIESIIEAIQTTVGTGGSNFNKCLDAQSSRIMEITVASAGIKNSARDCVISAKHNVLDVMKARINTEVLRWKDVSRFHQLLNVKYVETEECLYAVKQAADPLISKISQDIEACMTQQ